MLSESELKPAKQPDDWHRNFLKMVYTMVLAHRKLREAVAAAAAAMQKYTAGLDALSEWYRDHPMAMMKDFPPYSADVQGLAGKAFAARYTEIPRRNEDARLALVAFELARADVEEMLAAKWGVKDHAW